MKISDKMKINRDILPGITANKSGNGGFTLPEILIATFIFIIVVVAIYSIWMGNMRIFFTRTAMRDTQRDLRGLFLSVNTDIKQAFRIEDPKPDDDVSNSLIVHIFNKEVSSGGPNNTNPNMTRKIQYTFDSTAQTVTRTDPSDPTIVFNNITEFNVHPMNNLPSSSADWTSDKSDGASYSHLKTDGSYSGAKVTVWGDHDTACGVLVNVAGIARFEEDRLAEWGADDLDALELNFLAGSLFLMHLYEPPSPHIIFNSLDAYPDF